jgi:murein DD-endopeptidase MepM/ murein hydrolase activator NlpD
LAPIGITFREAETGKSPQGGPFIAAPGLHFVERAAMLSRALDEITALRRSAEAMPLAMPVRSARISSRYGYRQDPFLNLRALHAGLDFAASTGTEVQATAAGEVVSAGWNGGYG